VRGKDDAGIIPRKQLGIGLSAFVLSAQKVDSGDNENDQMYRCEERWYAEGRRPPLFEEILH
jgi:hypothetical protein